VPCLTGHSRTTRIDDRIRRMKMSHLGRRHGYSPHSIALAVSPSLSLTHNLIRLGARFKLLTNFTFLVSSIGIIGINHLKLLIISSRVLVLGLTLVSFALCRRLLRWDYLLGIFATWFSLDHDRGRSRKGWWLMKRLDRVWL
jgi:hypothetical protein